jgi:hypothetical protein
MSFLTVLDFPWDSISFTVLCQLVVFHYLILATQKPQFVGKSGGISSVKKPIALLE